MITVLVLLAILVTWSAIPLGRAIAQQVPDEVRSSRAWLAYARDGVVIAAIGIAVSSILPAWIALVGVVALACVRWLFPTRWSFAAASALALGLGIVSAPASIVLVIGANVIAGALENKAFIARTIAQPVGAVLVALLFTIVV